MTSGPLPAVGEGPAWCAPPFGDPAASTRCRVTGGSHQPADGATGTCTGCGARLDATSDGAGLVWWVEDITPAA